MLILRAAKLTCPMRPNVPGRPCGSGNCWEECACAHRISQEKKSGPMLKAKPGLFIILMLQNCVRSKRILIYSVVFRKTWTAQIGSFLYLQAVLSGTLITQQHDCDFCRLCEELKIKPVWCADQVWLHHYCLVPWAAGASSFSLRLTPRIFPDVSSVFVGGRC